MTSYKTYTFQTNITQLPLKPSRSNIMDNVRFPWEIFRSCCYTDRL